MTEQMITVSTMMAAGLILLLVYFVRLAARGARTGRAGCWRRRWCCR
jgi:hypothetical protein